MRIANVTSKSIVDALCKVKLDSTPARRHTQTTMNRMAPALELRTPLMARLLMLGLVILTVIVILPR